MKKALSVLFALLIVVFALPFGARAAETTVNLPFDIAPPKYVSLARTEEFSDSPTTHGLAWMVANDLNRFLIGLADAEDKEAYLAPYGLSEFLLSVQVDWALDDVNDPVSGWHYNESWDYGYYGFGKDEEGRYQSSDWDITEIGLNSNDSIQSIWLFRGVPNDERWYGNPDTGWVGIRDQLNPDQYRYDEDEETLYIDFDDHTIYARMRYVFWGTRLNGEGRELFAYSDWSETASSGKNGEKFELPKTLPQPDISNLYLTDKEFNGNPVAAFTLTVPDELAKIATGIAARNGITRIETEARVKGDTEWTQMGNTDLEIKTGEMECALLHLVSEKHPSISKGTEIEVRCRYWTSCTLLEEDVEGPWSKVLSFGTNDINQHGSEGSGTVTPGENDKSSCPICHFCSQPLGLCIFIWLLIILLVLIVIIVIIVIAVKSSKKKKNQK